MSDTPRIIPMGARGQQMREVKGYGTRTATAKHKKPGLIAKMLKRKTK